MTRPHCLVPGCTTPARMNPWAAREKHSRFCRRHYECARRHGDPLQPTVRIQVLRPLVREIKKLIDRDKTGKLEAVATQLSLNLRDYAEDVITEIEAGRLVPYWTAAGACELLKALTQSTPVECACAAAALFLLRERDPRQFVSEWGWGHEFVRAWRKQCSVTAIGSFWDHRNQKHQRKYRELPFRVVRRMSQLLITTYAPFASRVINLDRKKLKMGAAIKAALDEGFAQYEQGVPA